MTTETENKAAIEFPKILTGKRALVSGVANKRSIAWAIAQALHAAGAEIIFTYQGERLKPELEKVCDSVAYQNFKVDKNEYKNVIGSIGLENKQRIIIGAHYDVCGDSEGADDNASGVVGLLELARLLSKEKLKYRIDFVAFSLEEPPFLERNKWGVICTQIICLKIKSLLKE